jgi:hypothetical protein
MRVGPIQTRDARLLGAYMTRKFMLAGAAALIVGALSLPASAQISPGRSLDSSVRAGDSMVEQVATQKRKRTAKKKSNVRSKSYSWQNVRGSTSPRYLPNGRGMR